MATPKASVERWRNTIAALAGPLPVWYLLGLMDRLSGGNSSFEGPAGGRGLFGISPRTAERLDMDPDQLWDPAVNGAVAVSLIQSRAQEIAETDPDIGAERPADLSLLTTASYLWGPGILLPAFQAGDTAAAVFARLDPEIGEFAVDVMRRGEAYQEDGNGSAILPQEPEPRSMWGSLAWIAGLAVIGAGVWFLVSDSEE